jgi:HSP20 family molecular chaperone IbpA
METKSQNLENTTQHKPARTASQPQFTLRPPVDVFEDGEGITLWADMPGVSRERLNLHVDGNSLLLEGNIEFPMAENLEALHAEVRSTQYRCTFGLSNELDTGSIEANLKDGVLTVRIPKRAELRPRRIEVRSA